LFFSFVFLSKQLRANTIVIINARRYDARGVIKHYVARYLYLQGHRICVSKLGLRRGGPRLSFVRVGWPTKRDTDCENTKIERRVVIDGRSLVFFFRNSVSKRFDRHRTDFPNDAITLARPRGLDNLQNEFIRTGQMSYYYYFVDNLYVVQVQYGRRELTG